ncbi:MAG: host specificity protein, partial [Rhodobacteraceae bacterium]|nr:host specificity protein [Paracoccaceae bacterium]
MATLVLAAAGSALGGAVGGSMAGLSSMVLGKALGATLGSMIDQKLMGLGSEPVETGRVDRFRVMGSSEGAALPRVFGRVRIAGQLIWSSRFLETVNSEDVGGKGGGGTTVREYSYSVSLAVALCEGEILRIGRIWADGQAMQQTGLTFRLHR